MTLPVTLSFHDDESPISLVSRLARANSYDTMQSLLDFTPTNREAIMRGDLDALQEISELSGIPVARLAFASIVNQKPGSNWKLGYAIFNKEMRPGTTLRYCPHCVLNDMATGVGRPVSRSYARSWWSCRGIEGCREHGCRLIEIALDTLLERDDFATYVASNIGQIRADVKVGEPSSSPLLDQFLLDSIYNPNRAVGLIYSIDAHIVSELSTYLGKFIQINRLTEWQDEATNPREWGFVLLSRGKTELERVLTETIDKTRPIVRNIEKFFGPLIDWLRRNRSKAAYRDVVSLFQAIGERRMPFGPGMTFINPIEERHMYCVNSAHLEFKIHKKRLKFLLLSNGLIDRQHLHDSSIYFDAAKARPIIENALENVTSNIAAEILGVEEGKFRVLVKSGIVALGEEREQERGYLRVQQLDLDEFQARLLQNATPVDQEDEEWMPLMEFAQTNQMALEKILPLIIEGVVSVRVLPVQAGLLARLRVNKSEVRRVRLQRKANSEEDFVTFNEAIKLLGSSEVTLTQLLKKGFVKEKNY